VVLQAKVWVDRRTHEHRLEQMTPDYRANVLTFLQHEATAWTDAAVIWELAAAVYGLTPGRDASEHLELLDLLTPGWTDHTPLGRRLHELNHTRPHPLAPPRIRVTARDSDHPEVLRDTDAGHWQVTTESRAVYLVDLDRRRVLRHPHTPVPSNGDHRPEAGPRLPYDHYWTHLDCLIRCRTGTGLVLTDRRPATEPRREEEAHDPGTAGNAPGYRISTGIIDIRRAAGPAPTTAPAGDN
jgi:hypothetical protein